MRKAFAKVLAPGVHAAMVSPGGGATSIAALQAALPFEVASQRPQRVTTLVRSDGMSTFLRRAARANDLHGALRFHSEEDAFEEDAREATTLLWDISDAADLPRVLAEVSAARRLLPQIKSVVPEAVKLHAELVQWPLSSASIAVALKQVEGFDVSRFNVLLPGDGASELVHLETQPHRKLTATFEALTVSTGNAPAEPARVQVEASQAGEANAIVFWTSPVDAGLEGLSTGSSCASCRQGLQVLKQSIKLEPGDKVNVTAQFLEGILTLDATKPSAKRIRMAGKRLAAKGSHIVPSWHFGMLNDHPRNIAYRVGVEDALQKRPKARVLDLGCGSSLLSMMAVRSGATSSICCELEPPIAQTATKIVAQNKLSNQVTVVNKDCTKLEIGDLPDSAQADVLVSEMIDTGLLGDEWLTLLDVARRKNLMKPNTVVVPNAAVVYAAGIELLPQPRPVFSHLPPSQPGITLDVSAFDLAGRNMTAIADVRLHEIQHKRLTADAEAFQFDFMKVPLDMHRSHTVALTAKEAGVVHAIAFWFTMDLGGGAQINTSPDTPDGPISHWKQAVQLLQDPITIGHPGQVLQFRVSHDPSRISFEHLP